ncbi:MAG: hypothetical protein ACE5LB_18125 [Acidiferrobacterales bacterium]
MTSQCCWLEILTLVGLFALSSVQAGPLHDATEKGDLDEVKRLIAQGADVNAKYRYRHETRPQGPSKTAHRCTGRPLTVTLRWLKC